MKPPRKKKREPEKSPPPALMKKKQMDQKKMLARSSPIRRLAELRSSSPPNEFLRVMAEFFFVLREAKKTPVDDFRFVMVSSNAVHEVSRSIESDISWEMAERDELAKDFVSNI